MSSDTGHPPNDPQRERARERARRMVFGYAARGPYDLHPDPVRVEAVIGGLARHLARHGKLYCPCMPIEESLKKGKANCCPCEAHHRDIAETGACECDLFVARRPSAQADEIAT